MISFFYAPGSATVKAFKEAVSADLLPHIAQVMAHKDNRPKRGDLILKAGKGSASAAEERYAWRLGGYVIYVPECSDWLTHRVREAVDAGTDLVLVDSSLATTNQLSGAR